METLLGALFLFNVFGVDDRFTPNLNQEPYSRIVRLSSGCTGALVGRDLVLTAAHCVPTGVPVQLPNGISYVIPVSPRVYSKFSQGKYDDEAEVAETYYGTRDPQNDRSKDWAVLKLKKPLGEKYGWFEKFEELRDLPNADHRVSLAGYSGDWDHGQVMSAHTGCRIREVRRVDYFINHDCDMMPGASGSPLFRCDATDCSIVGVNVAHYPFADAKDRPVSTTDYSSRFPNLAVGAYQFSKKIIELRAVEEVN